MDAEPRRVALLGGAFDPPHRGHLRLAELAWECLRPDELRFVPSLVSPMKSAPIADAGARLAMLKSMLLGTPFSVDTIELSRPGESFTVDTLEALSGREPGKAWVLVVGSDRAADFDGWKNSGRVLELASVAIAVRPGIPAAGLSRLLSARLAKTWDGLPGRVIKLPGTDMELASRQIRGQFSEGPPPPGLTEDVLATILRRGLYR